MDTHTAFRPDDEGFLVDRPNRFVVRVDLGGRVVEAHCPNPGRMTELLYPGTPVILERAPQGRKLAYTLVALKRPGPRGVVTIPLASARSNAAVGALVLPGMFPGATLVQPEYTLGTSRFDWYVEDPTGRHLIEVKACSEVEYGSALFPDAPSLRAVKHLKELAHWTTQGYRSHVVFAVVHGRPETFGPNRHTDPGFARTLASLAPALDLRAVVFETSQTGTTHVANADLPINLGPSQGLGGPDAGLLVRLDPVDDRWSVVVEAYTDGWSRAVTKAPARRSFALNVAPSHRDELSTELGTDWGHDPRTDRRFVETILRWRHGAVDKLD